MPDPQQAFNTLFSQVHNPVFFAKLANDYGIAPRSENEARTLLEMAGKLRIAADNPNIKAAAAGTDPFSEASQALDNMLSGNSSADVSILKLAADVSANASIYQSVVALKVAQAQELAATKAA